MRSFFVREVTSSKTSSFSRSPSFLSLRRSSRICVCNRYDGASVCVQHGGGAYTYWLRCSPGSVDAGPFRNKPVVYRRTTCSGASLCTARSKAENPTNAHTAHTAHTMLILCFVFACWTVAIGQPATSNQSYHLMPLSDGNRVLVFVVSYRVVSCRACFSSNSDAQDVAWYRTQCNCVTLIVAFKVQIPGWSLLAAPWRDLLHPRPST